MSKWIEFTDCSGQVQWLDLEEGDIVSSAPIQDRSIGAAVMSRHEGEDDARSNGEEASERY